MEPWLSYNGIELGNAVRTLSYLRRGLVPGQLFEIPASGSDLNDASQLACYCDEMNDGPYVDPATDLAPWWDAAKPESDSFLGFIPWTITLQPKLGRNVTEGGMIGTQLGKLIAGGSIVAVSGVLYSITEAGIEYGERWLIAALRGTICDTTGCDVGSLCLLPSCPEGAGYTSSAFRTLYQTGLIDYVPAQPVDPAAAWYMRQVSFQFQSENPYMYEDAVPLALAQSMRRNAVVGTAVTGEWPGEAGIRVKVDVGSPNDIGPLRITGASRKPGTDVCNGPGGFDGATSWWDLQKQSLTSLQPFTPPVPNALPINYAVDLTGHGIYMAAFGGRQPVQNYDGVKVLWIPDGNGNLTTPDSANLSITSDISIEVCVEVNQWNTGSTGFFDLCSKWDGGAGQSSWLFRWNRSTQQLEFLHSSNGTATVSTGVANWQPRGSLTDLDNELAGSKMPPRRVWFRVELDVVNGANHTKTFYFSEDGVNFAVIGASTFSGTTAIFDSTSAVYFCGRQASGFFRGRFVKGVIATGLWSAANTVNKADPNIDTDASPTSATFSDGTQTWTITRPASGGKAAVVHRYMSTHGLDQTNTPGAIWLTSGLNRFAQPGDFRANESFTVYWYGKLWGTSTGQTLMGRRSSTAAGAGWELRRGSSANTPQAVIHDGVTPITAAASGAFTAGTEVVIVMVRDVVADTLRVVVNNVAGTPVTDTTTGDLFVAWTATSQIYTTIGALYDSTNGIGSAADAEFYGAAIFHGVAHTAGQIATETTRLQSMVSAQSSPDFCFDVQVPSLPAGSTLVIDGATHTVQVRNESDGLLLGGLGYLDLSGPMTWPEQGPCSEVCWSVDPMAVFSSGSGGTGLAAEPVGNTNTTVTIEQFNREV